MSRPGLRLCIPENPIQRLELSVPAGLTKNASFPRKRRSEPEEACIERLAATAVGLCRDAARRHFAAVAGAIGETGRPTAASVYLRAAQRY